MRANSGRTFLAINPAKEQPIAAIPEAGPEDVDMAVEAAAIAFPVWYRRSREERAWLLLSAARKLRDYSVELGRLETLHRGTPVRYTVPAFLQAADDCETAINQGIALLGSEIPAHQNPALFFQPVPRGICSFSPSWYTPFRTLAPRIVLTLAVGNTCIVRCPEADSLVPLRFMQLITDLGIPDGTINVITGKYGYADNALSRHSFVNVVAADGYSPCMHDFAASHHLESKEIPASFFRNPVPCALLDDADIVAAARKISLTCYGLNGIAWPSPGRYYIHDTVYEAFVEQLVSVTGRVIVGDPMDRNTEIGPALTAAHRNKVQMRVEELLHKGATLVAADPSSPPCSPTGAFFLRPMILGGVTPEMTAMTENLFAPLVCLSRFSTTEELLALLHGLPSNECLWIWTTDASKGKYIADAIPVDYAWLGNDLIPICEPEEYDSTMAIARANHLNPADFIQLKLVHRDVTARFADVPKPLNYN